MMTLLTPRRNMMARSMPMNQPEDASVDCLGWWPAAMFRYVLTLWILLGVWYSPSTATTRKLYT